MPKPPWQRMRAKSKADEVAAHAPGAITRSTITLWQTPAARVVPVGDVQQRRTHPRLSQAIASWLRSKHWPMLKRIMGGRGWPPRSDAAACPDAEILQAYQDQNTM